MQPRTILDSWLVNVAVNFAMKSGMFSAAHHFEVFDAVVGFYPVFVMDYFRTLQASAQQFLHDVTMFEYAAFVWELKANVAIMDEPRAVEWSLFTALSGAQLGTKLVEMPCVWRLSKREFFAAHFAISSEQRTGTQCSQFSAAFFGASYPNIFSATRILAKNNLVAHFA